jgi:hypothetical protein
MVAPLAAAATVSQAGDTSHCGWKDRKMRFGETNPTSPPTGIGGRSLRGAPAGSIASNWRNKANRAGTAETPSAASGPNCLLRRIRVWGNKATASPTRPYGAPPSTRTLGQNLQNELIYEISMKSTTPEASEPGRGRRVDKANPPGGTWTGRAILAEQSHRRRDGAMTPYPRRKAPVEHRPDLEAVRSRARV